MCWFERLKVGCADASEQHQAAAEIERLHTIVDAIDFLRRDEGDSVEIVCDNPEFSGPSSAVIVSGEWCGYHGRRFDGESVAEALAKAVKAREAAEKAKEES